MTPVHTLSETQSNDGVEPKTLVKKCTIAIVNTHFCTGPKVYHSRSQHSFSTLVVKGLTDRIKKDRNPA